MAQFAKEVALMLEKIGLTTIIIPFALTFVIMYSVLQKTKILGRTEKDEPKKNLNMVVAVIISFLVVAYADTVAVVSRIAQYGVVLLIIAVLAVIMFGFTGFPKIGKNKIMTTLGLLAFIVFVFYVLGGFELIEKGQLETRILVPIIGIAAFLFVLYLIMRPRKETGEEKGKRKTPEYKEGEERTPREGGFGP